MEETSDAGGWKPVEVGGGEQEVLLELLSHPYRRFVLAHLDETDDSHTVSEVAAELGAWQAELSLANRTARGVDAIETVLHHCHLPKLAEANVIEYEPTQGAVMLAAGAPAARSHLDALGYLDAPGVK